MRNLLRVVVSALALIAPIDFAAAVERHPVVLGASQAEEAVAYQINPAHSGNITFAAGFAAPLKQIWAKNLGATLSYPVIADGMVFVTASDNSVTALNVLTGAQVYKKSVGGATSTLGPAYDNGKIFVLGDGGLLSSYTSTTGRPGWSALMPNQWSFSSAPSAMNGFVYTGGAGDGGTLYAVNETNGAMAWMQGVANGDDSSPAIGDGGVYVSYPCQYYKFDPVSGKLLWLYNNGCDGGGGNTPVYFAGRVYVQDWSSGNYTLDAKTGALKGSFAASNGYPPAFGVDSKGHKFSVSFNSGTLRAWNVSTQNIYWSFAGDGQLSTAPIIVNDMVIEGSASGEVYALGLAKGRRLWSANTGSAVTHLSAGLGTLIVISGQTVTAYVPG